MTAIPVRDTQFAAWHDPDAWMESMTGARWNAVLQEERNLVKEALIEPSVLSRIGAFRAQYSAQKDKEKSFYFLCGPIQVEWLNTFFKKWWFSRSPQRTHVARDITANQTMVWTTEDVGCGAEEFQLQSWSGSATKPVWSKSKVGPDVALLGGRLYYLNVENKLIYHEVWSCDAKTGENEELEYREANPMVNLALEKHSNGCLLMIRDNSQDIEVYRITGPKTFIIQASRWIAPPSWIMPIYERVGYGIDFLWPERGILVTKQHGKKTIWLCSKTRSAKKLLELPAGEILFNPYEVWVNSSSCYVRVEHPAQGTLIYLWTGRELVLESPAMPTGLHAQRIMGYSPDETEVHGLIVHKFGVRADKLLVVGYGAYGMPTSIGSPAHRWAPLLENGWCIAYAFVRGGGDHTDAWAKAGRREGRTKTIDDFVAIIRSAQRDLYITYRKTCIYGRSAGGLLVGGTLAKYPTGYLMRAVYAEVPYVDELRTTTNPELPLTQIEYNEFGNPLERLEDFISVGCLSPADSAATLKTPDIFVLSRTAENDSQVFAYESVKWIRRLRAAAGNSARAPKLCIVEKGQGHFTPPDATEVQWSMDCALLDTWMEGGLGSPGSSR
jgi:protease II